MTKLRLTVITCNQKTKEKAQKLSDLMKSIVSTDSFEQIDKYTKSNDSFKISLVFDCDPTLNLANQMIEIADRLFAPWTTYFDRTNNSVDLIYNKTDSCQIRRNEFNVIDWAEFQIDEE